MKQRTPNDWEEIESRESKADDLPEDVIYEFPDGEQLKDDHYKWQKPDFETEAELSYETSADQHEEFATSDLTSAQLLQKARRARHMCSDDETDYAHAQGQQVKRRRLSFRLLITGLLLAIVLLEFIAIKDQIDLRERLDQNKDLTATLNDVDDKASATRETMARILESLSQENKPTAAPESVSVEIVGSWADYSPENTASQTN